MQVHKYYYLVSFSHYVPDFISIMVLGRNWIKAETYGRKLSLLKAHWSGHKPRISAASDRDRNEAPLYTWIEIHPCNRAASSSQRQTDRGGSTRSFYVSYPLEKSRVLPPPRRRRSNIKGNRQPEFPRVVRCKTVCSSVVGFHAHHQLQWIIRECPVPEHRCRATPNWD